MWFSSVIQFDSELLNSSQEYVGLLEQAGF